MSDSTEELREPLGRWLTERLPHAEAVRVGPMQRHEGGYSAETIVVPIEVRSGGAERRERVVLRLEVDGTAVYPQQAPGLDVEVEIQYRAMQGLRRASELPLAELIGYESDRGVLGNAFFVMRFVEGAVPSVDPPYPREGFFREASPEDRSRLIRNGLRTLAELHRVDWRQAGFEWLVPPGTEPGTLAQLELWERFAQRELREREHPVMRAGFEWLHAHLPRDSSIGVSWGDSRPGNIIWRDFEPVCLTDFENVAVGPPELDLGWWLMFDRTMHEWGGVPRPPGDLGREQQLDFYAEVSGRDLNDMHYYEVLAAARYCAIVVRVMNRHAERGQLPPENTLWRHNPPTSVLAELLGMPEEA
ncbi:MAG: phosphotransferase family protein [Proteobacteria bacterium]|nr:phosphotransferase family protein [Pseudomonadota bacterium]